ncbi:MAG: hypothetical protein R3272_03230 [Candidatus Promineifilaceae bacterium]|nr:hypothetical protein [Candidatus Promineifilaceae bacterium]
MLRLLGLVLIALALILGLFTVAAYLGWQSGTTLRTEQAAQAQETEVGVQLERARADIEEGHFQLALRRLEWVLEQDPDNEQAEALQMRAQAAQQRAEGTRTITLRTATATAVESAPTAEDVPEDTREPLPDQPAAQPELERELARIEALLAQEAWEEALAALLAFQGEHPAYERERTDELLFDLYVTHGVDLLYSEQVELGLYYLSRAERLGTLSQEVRGQMLWAELYLGGMAYYGVNWAVAADFFRELCPAAPFYQGACEKLYTSLVARGDQFANSGEWCPAVPWYEEAYQVDATGAVSDKLANAREGCRNATPTPDPLATPTLTPAPGPITPTETVTGTTPLNP